MYMLSLADLRRKALKERIPQAIIEKDYALSFALNAIADSKLSENLIFKGGTALNKVYFKEARFSEDLDFNVIKINKDQIIQELKEILDEKEMENVRFEKIKEEKTNAGLKLSLKYTGPLVHTQTINFDFNFRDNLILEPVKKSLIDTYNLGEHSIMVLSLEEILAEKIHALASRSAPRDLYDTWFLLGKGQELNKNHIEKKYWYYKEKLEVSKIESSIENMKLKWHNDLPQLMPKTPNIDSVAKEVLEKIRKIENEPRKRTN